MLGIIGGSGVYEIANIADSKRYEVIQTEYGEVEVSFLTIEDNEVAFISRHARGHSIPPHMINYKANIQALKNIGVTQIIATNSVGSLNLDLEIGDLVLVDDFLDFTIKRDKTFFDDKVIHVDVTNPYCPRLREELMKYGSLKNGATLVCTEGPRFETPAEIKMFSSLGVDLVGMTSIPEVVLAREKEMCYASICIVSNYAAGISQSKITHEEVLEIVETKMKDLVDIIYTAVKTLNDDFDCDCLHAIE